MPTISTMLDIYKLGDEILSRKCKRVSKFDSSVSLLADAMFETMEDADGVGLAAPQVGVDMRLFVVNDQQGHRMAFVNPEIIETSAETVVMEEGCLSIPMVWHDVERAASVTVQAQDVKGQAFRVEASGLFARAILHENDHLNGICFIDRLPEAEKEKMIRRYEKKNHVKLGRT
ncbi:MAG: peptide deformylase [Spirochaetia bacterium]|nr:peptide deformylase [Spirochaetia bacterium]